MAQDILDTAVRFVKGVGEVRAAQLNRLDIHTVRDLLFTLPRRYEDRRVVTLVAGLHAGEWATVAGTVRSVSWQQPRFGRGFVEALLSDASGTLLCRWFGARHLQNQLVTGEALVVYGKPVRRRGVLVLEHPDLERMDEERDESLHMGRIVPVYPLTEQLAQRTLRRILWQAVEKYADDGGGCAAAGNPAAQDWMRLPEALRTRCISRPASAAAARARARLVFEEFLCMQLVLVARKVQAETFPDRSRPGGAGSLWWSNSGRQLPFRLTEGQEQAVREIRADMEKARPMHRLAAG
jgi:ATP-dependent DNA helicase RecG